MAKDLNHLWKINSCKKKFFFFLILFIIVIRFMYIFSLTLFFFWCRFFFSYFIIFPIKWWITVLRGYISRLHQFPTTTDTKKKKIVQSFHFFFLPSLFSLSKWMKLFWLSKRNFLIFHQMLFEKFTKPGLKD